MLTMLRNIGKSFTRYQRSNGISYENLHMSSIFYVSFIISVSSLNTVVFPPSPVPFCCIEWGTFPFEAWFTSLAWSYIELWDMRGWILYTFLFSNVCMLEKFMMYDPPSRKMEQTACQTLILFINVDRIGEEWWTSYNMNLAWTCASE